MSTTLDKTHQEQAIVTPEGLKDVIDSLRNLKATEYIDRRMNVPSVAEAMATNTDGTPKYFYPEGCEKYFPEESTMDGTIYPQGDYKYVGGEWVSRRIPTSDEQKVGELEQKVGELEQEVGKLQPKGNYVKTITMSGVDYTPNTDGKVELPSGGGSGAVVDLAFDTNSANAIANKVVAQELYVNIPKTGVTTRTYALKAGTKGTGTSANNYGSIMVDIRGVVGRIYVHTNWTNAYVAQWAIDPVGNAFSRFGDTLASGNQDYYVDLDGTESALYVMCLINNPDAVTITYNNKRLDYMESRLQKLEGSIGGANPNVYVEKSAERMNVYVKCANGFYVEYPFFKRVKDFVSDTDSFYDNWGIEKPYLATYEGNGVFLEQYQIFRVGESEIALYDATAQKYVGGGTHGFDKIITDERDDRNFAIFVDNKQIGESEVYNGKCENVRVMSRAHFYSWGTTTDPFAIADKEWIIDKSGVQINTKLTFLRQFSIKNAQMGMFCVLQNVDGSSSKPYLTTKAMKNTAPFHVYDITGGAIPSQLQQNDPLCTKITEWGNDLGLGFAMEVLDSNKESNGGMFVQTNGSNYNKIYFDLCGNVTRTKNEGETLHSSVKWTIE